MWRSDVPIVLVSHEMRAKGVSSAAVVVNVSERGRRWKEHDEAVKMVNFSRTKKPAKCDLSKNPRESLLQGARPRE